MASSQNLSSPYVPNYVYHASKPVTQSEFENPRLYAMSVPTEEGFFQDPKGLNKAIRLVNLSGRALTFVKDDPQEFNRLYGDQRFNEKETAGVTLGRGRSTHFVCHSSCYIVTIGEYVVGEDGKKYWETALGKRLSEIANTAITITEGKYDGSLKITVNGNSEQNMYFTAENASDRTLYGQIVAESTAYAQSPSMIEAERKSRKPDLGGKVIEQFKIEPGATLYYKKPPCEYVIRALDPFQPHATGRGSNIGTSRVVIVAPVNNYVEDAKVEACCGDTVVALADENNNGCVRLVRYDSDQLKPVKDDIVISN